MFRAWPFIMLTMVLIVADTALSKTVELGSKQANVSRADPGDVKQQPIVSLEPFSERLREPPEYIQSFEVYPDAIRNSGQAADAFLGMSSGLWVALFTFFLAISTLFLWRATRNSVAIATRSLHDLERAFVFLDGFDADIGQIVEPGDPTGRPDRLSMQVSQCRIRPKWKNSGSSPTRNMSFQIGRTTSELATLPDDFLYPLEEKPHPLFVGPKATEGSEFIVVAAGYVTAAVQEQGQTNFFIWGRADYKDIFSPRTHQHFIQWCYRINFVVGDDRRIRMSPVQWGPYNRSDSDQ